MVLKRIDPVSCGKMVGGVYFGIGLLIGCVFAVLSLFGAGIAASTGESEAWLGVLLGVGAVVFLPLLYGVLMFLVGMLIAALYNLVARLLGGIELQLE